MNISGATADKPIDFIEINKAALARGRTFLEALIPGGKFRSLEYIVRNPCRDDRQPGSFSINYKSGVWKDFATDDRGNDLVSLYAYVRGISQSAAAREMAGEMGVSFLKTENANGHHRNGKSSTATAAEKPRIYNWGNAGPPVRDDEIRRHDYSVAGRAMKLKIKKRGERPFIQWYRVFRDGVAVGWQAQRPDSYIDVPYVSAALDPFDPEMRLDEIFWPEGEKDVDTLSKLNVPAFTFGGTGDGLPDGVELYLKDCRVVILADNDDAGRDHAEKKAAIAHASGAASIKVVHFPKLPEKGDVSDFIAGGGTVEQLNARIDAAPLWPTASDTQSESGAKPNGKAGTETGGTTSPSGERSIVAIRANTLTPESVRWAWKNRFAFGKLAIIAGDPGLGKSTMLIEIAALHSKGGEFPCGEGRAVQCEVAILTAEDGLQDTLVPRLMAAEADRSKIHFLTGTKTADATNDEAAIFDISRDIPALREYLKANPAIKLLIIDPITAYLGSGIKAKENTDVRRVLAPIVRLIEDFSLCLVVNNHLNKSAGKALYRVLDSIAFAAVGRIVHLVVADADNRENRKFICEKINIGSMPLGLTYLIQKDWIKGEQGEDIETSRISWGTTTIDETADEALGTNDDAPTMAEGAEELLRDILAKGRMSVTDIAAEAKAAGMLGANKEIRNSKPFRTACARLGIVHEHEGFGAEAVYYWKLQS